MQIAFLAAGNSTGYTQFSSSESAPVRFILYVGAQTKLQGYGNTRREVEIANISPNEAMRIMGEGRRVPDIVMIHPHHLTSEILKLKEAAKARRIPIVIYTSDFENSARQIAIDLGTDDYLYGSVNSSFLKRIDFLKRLSSYKSQRGDKPYGAAMPEPRRNLFLWILKRTLDIVIASTALLALLPVGLIIALIIKLESRGPVFYVSKRAGDGYRIFNFYKFRSMRQGADKELQKLAHLNQYSKNSGNGVFFKIQNDPRITRFGQFLRNTSLDEIPQLINVLTGDMSLVGNRPLPLYEAEQLTKDGVAWRFHAPAGITGLWQITKRGKENMSPDERITLDVEYAMKNSLWMDLKILAATLPAIFQKEKV